LAEWFKKHPAKVNILFVAFAGEEAGLKGSEWFVVDRPLDFSRIKLVLNLDLNGTGDDGITVVNATEQKAVYDKLVAINTKTQDLPQVKARGPACNSDHCPFVQKGIPAIFIYTMGGVSYYHDVNDRPETLPLTKFDGLYRTLVALIGGMR
ncbi:MAG: M28 family peptidase, partial [Bacteroidetes bacterium]|nr:M28 family peptidase [Bacteroidota bacterium]